MLQYEILKQICNHSPYRAVIMHGKVMHWRCKCGRIVAAPEGESHGIVIASRRNREMEGLEPGTTGAALHGRGKNVVQSKGDRGRPVAY